jgi:hypothetical protein
MTSEAKREYHRRYRQTTHYKQTRKAIQDNANLLQNHNVNMDWFVAKLKEQGNVCAICGRPPSCQARRFSVDHNHKTNQIRGILCSWCNRIVVPLIEDYRWILKPAIRYYKKYQSGK